ncbi:MAG: hypothetical protein NC250_01695 [Alistipes senegalensis]|nr:hypothetical protein [Bacteroides cellulosilyticus]MCM1351430.1 hypothetical protein [Alistipes senegalensis]
MSEKLSIKKASFLSKVIKKVLLLRSFLKNRIFVSGGGKGKRNGVQNRTRPDRNGRIGNETTAEIARLAAKRLDKKAELATKRLNKTFV